MILMPILLMNLLIGLAVGDIESVRRNAQLKRLAMQVNFSNIEITVVRNNLRLFFFRFHCIRWCYILNSNKNYPKCGWNESIRWN